MAEHDVKPNEDQPGEERRPNVDAAPDHTPIQSPAPAGYRPGDDPVEAKREAATRRRAAAADEEHAPPVRREAPRAPRPKDDKRG